MYKRQLSEAWKGSLADVDDGIVMILGSGIAGGLINKQVADRLGIGLTTVISHRRNIMEKLGIRTAAGLVVYALAAGYVDPDGM